MGIHTEKVEEFRIYVLYMLVTMLLSGAKVQNEENISFDRGTKGFRGNWLFYTLYLGI